MEFIIHHWTEKSKAKELAEYITEQLAGLEDIRKKPMMGGYIFYYRERIFGGTYGTGFMVKITEASRKYMPDSIACPPYDGAKEMLPVTIIDDRELLQKMVSEMFSELPERKPKTRKAEKKMKTKLYTNNIHQYLQCSDIIDFDNESVAQLADKLYSASNGETDFIRKAFEYVRDHISHSADIGADEVPCTASQVLKAGHGICFAKSHLLAAILRSRGIPAGFCYQKIVLNDDADVPELVYHGLNGVYLREHDKWIRLDARGNKEGVNAQFSIDTEQLAFPIRTDKGEQDDFTVYPVPDKEIIDVLASNNSRAQLWAVLPMQLEYYNAIKTTESENSKI